MYEAYKGKDLEILAVNTGESKEDVISTINSKGIKYRVLIDKDGKVSDLYKVKYIPLSVLIDKKGNILYIDNPVPPEDLCKKAMEN